MALETEGKADDNTIPGERPGLDLSVSDLCFALKTKVAMAIDSPGKLSIASILSVEADLTIVVITLRRMANSRNSIAHRLPPEILEAVASYFKDNHRSLISATHLCQYWRSTLLSCPRFWTHIGFENEKRALAFMERSGSLPVSVSLNRSPSIPKGAGELSATITNRVISLRGAANSSMSRFLAQPLPSLQNIFIAKFGYPWEPTRLKTMPTLPSVRSLVTTDVGCPLFHVPNLTDFRFQLGSESAVPHGFADGLLAFFRGCPLLETVFLTYGGGRVGNTESLMDYPPAHPVSLPCLRSFTRLTRQDAITNALFNKISLPPTCDVAFAVTTNNLVGAHRQWTSAFPTPRNPHYFSDVKTVKIKSYFRDEDTEFRVELLNSQNTRSSFTRNIWSSGSSIHPRNSDTLTKFLDFLERRIADSIETLHFERYPIPLQHGGTPMDLTRELLRFGNLETLVLWQCDLIIFLANPPSPDVWCPTIRSLVVCLPPLVNSWEPTEVDVLKLVRSVAVSRQMNGNPLETITMYSRDNEGLLRACEREMEELRSCVGLMEVVRLEGWRGMRGWYER